MFQNRIDAAHDGATGISIRFIREWKPEAPQPISVAEHAWAIAVCDARDCSFAEKYRDAYAYLLTHPRVTGAKQRVIN